MFSLYIRLYRSDFSAKYKFAYIYFLPFIQFDIDTPNVDFHILSVGDMRHAITVLIANKDLLKPK